MGKQPELWTNVSIKKIGSMSTGEHQSTIKKDEILPLAATRLELEDTMVASLCSPLRCGSEDADLHAEEVGCGFQDLGREWR